MGQIIYLTPKDDKTIKKNSSELHGHGTHRYAPTIQVEIGRVAN